MIFKKLSASYRPCFSCYGDGTGMCCQSEFHTRDTFQVKVNVGCISHHRCIIWHDDSLAFVLVESGPWRAIGCWPDAWCVYVQRGCLAISLLQLLYVCISLVPHILSFELLVDWCVVLCVCFLCVCDSVALGPFKSGEGLACLLVVASRPVELCGWAHGHRHLPRLLTYTQTCNCWDDASQSQHTDAIQTGGEILNKTTFSSSQTWQ